MADRSAGDTDDPLERLEINEKQGARAYYFVLLSVGAMLALAVAMLVVTDATGTPRVWLVVAPTVLGMILSVTSALKAYGKWREHIRWRPWLFATYAMWIATTACLLITSSTTFVQIG